MYVRLMHTHHYITITHRTCECERVMKVRRNANNTQSFNITSLLSLFVSVYFFHSNPIMYSCAART